MSPAVERALEDAAPTVLEAIEGLILALLHRQDALTAAEWHLTKAAHDLASEKVLEAEGML